jgi:hypothetical protein
LGCHFAEEEREIQNKYTVEDTMLDSKEELPEVNFSLSLSLSLFSHSIDSICIFMSMLGLHLSFFFVLTGIKIVNRLVTDF